MSGAIPLALVVCCSASIPHELRVTECEAPCTRPPLYHSTNIDELLLATRNASTRVMLMAPMIRAANAHIYGRKPIPHHQLVKEITKKYGTDMGNTIKVLKEYSGYYNLLMIELEKPDPSEVDALLESKRCVLIRLMFSKN